MSTEFINDQWRLPNAWNGSESNVNKQSNYSMDFDGSNYISLPSSLDLGTNSTISLWFKSDSGNTNNTILGEDSYQYDYLLQIASGSNEAAIRIGGIVKPFTGITEINDGNWNHWCIVRNGDSVELFINNSSKGTQTGYGTGTNTKFEKIGAEGDNQFPITGKIDAVSIFNYALSTSQVTTLYGSSSTGIGNPQSITPNPVAMYNLGDQDAFNGANYLVPNSSLKDYVFDFDGSNAQSVNCGNDNSLQATTALTLSAWIKYTTDDTNFRYVLTRRDLNDTNYMLYLNNTTGSKTLKFGSNGTATSSGSVTYNQWHHVAVTVNGTSVSFYIDGQPAGTSTINGINSFADKDFIIGDVTYSTTYEFAGLISNPKMFNTALSSTEVETLYNNGSPLTSMSGFTSLQAWWKLDASATYDSSTTTWTIPDDSTNSNDGTSSGMTQANLVQSDLSFTSGYSPYALDFDGANDYIDAGVTVQQPTTNYSVSCWVKLDSVALCGIVGNFKTGAAPQVGFALTLSSGLNFQFWSDGTASSSAGTVTGTSTPNSSTWYNVIGVYDGSLVKIYVNNVLENSVSYSATPSVTDQNLVIGRWYGNYDGFYTNGSISNVSVWNTALTSAQVTEIYSEGIPQNLNNHSAVSSLVSWWQLGSNSSFNTNWTVLDEKGSNNGVSSNMTESDIVDGVNTYGGGTSSGMGGDEVIGDAPYSTANSLSVNMDVLDRVTDTPS